MAVNFDEAGRQHFAAGIDRRRLGLDLLADFGDAVAGNRDIAGPGVGSGAIDDAGVPDEQRDLAHGTISPLPGSGIRLSRCLDPPR